MIGLSKIKTYQHNPKEADIYKSIMRFMTGCGVTRVKFTVTG